jgi:energy-coupling factor transport system substrate-specific component
VLATPVEVIGGHYGIAVIYGLWFIGGTLTGYVVRKPWAAFLGETIGAIIELLALSPYSILLYYYGPAQGIMSELAFAIFRYKKWDYTSMFLAGALPAIAAYPFDVLVSPFYPEAIHYTLVTHVTLFMGYLLSGAILGGFLVKFIVDAAVKAGAIKL